MASKKPAKKKPAAKPPAVDVPAEPLDVVRTMDGQDVPAAELAHLHPFIQRYAVRVDSLVPDPDNARLHPQRNLDAIAASLKKYGQQPLLLTFDPSTRVVKVGNGRLRVATDPKYGLNWTWVAAIPSNLPAAELKAFALADNRTAELAEWDPDVVARQLEELEDELDGFAALDVGFDAGELDALLAGDTDKAHGFAPAKPKPPSPPPGGDPTKPVTYQPKWLVIVTCGSEQEQAKLIDEFEGRGLNLKAPSA